MLSLSCWRPQQTWSEYKAIERNPADEWASNAGEI
jgi:hypothetical protein